MAKAQVSTLRVPPKVFKFNESSVLKKTSRRNVNYVCKDSEDNKLQIQVSKLGRKVYITNARVKGGNPTKVTHGVVGEIKLKTAKDMHNHAMSLIRQGINPNDVIAQDELPSIRDSVEDYIKYNRQLSDSTRKLYMGLLRNHLTDKMFYKPFEELNEMKFLEWHKS